MDRDSKKPRIPVWLSVAVLILLSDYLRIRLHDVWKLANPTAAALGFLLSGSAVCLADYFTGDWKLIRGWKFLVIFIILASIVIYVIGRLFRW
jgi:membrane protein YdbS with pleckstrin-like domain